MRQKILLVMFFAASSALAQPKLDEKLLKSSFGDLKDPSSVQFRGLRYKEKTPGGWSMCGEFNAKNSFGGYVGFQRFSGVVMVDEKTKKTTYLVFGRGETAEAVCSQDDLM